MIEEVQMSLGDHSAMLHVINERAGCPTVNVIMANRKMLDSRFGIRALSFLINADNGTLDIHFFADDLKHVLAFIRWIKTVARIAGDWKNCDEDQRDGILWTLLDNDGTGINSVVWRDSLDAVRHYIDHGYA